MKNIPLGAWIFGGVLIVALVFYQAFVRIPQARMDAASAKIETCTKKTTLCYKQAETHVQSLLEWACIHYEYNSKADIDAATKVLQDCQAKGTSYDECRLYYLYRLQANCITANDTAGINKEETRYTNECLAKLYECK